MFVVLLLSGLMNLAIVKDDSEANSEVYSADPSHLDRERTRGLQPEALYYNFEEGNGNRVRDLSSSGGNDGTMQGVSFTTDSKHGRFALLCPGGNNNFRLDVGGDITKLNMPTAYTFMCWFKGAQGGNKGAMMFGDCCNPRNGYTMNVGSNQVRFWGGWDNANQNFNTYANNVNMYDNQWHHIAIRCNNQQLQIVIDGQTRVTGSSNVPTSPSRAGPGSHCDNDPCIGGDPISGNNDVTAIIDEAAIFSRFLSDAEIREAMDGLTSIPSVENVRLIDPTGDDNVCYTEYTNYTLSVNVTTMDTLDEVYQVDVYLDYNTTNATLGYNWSQGRFYKRGDPNDHVHVLLNECTVENDGVEKWYLNFSIIINFTFPHEDMIDCFVNTTAQTSEFTYDRFIYLFRVENDLQLNGVPAVEAEFQGELAEGDWIRGNETLNFTNLTVSYDGAPEVYPHDDHFDVKVMDSTGGTWWDNESSGESTFVGLTSRNVTDTEEEYGITIESIPESGICKTNLTFAVKIDAVAPLRPLNLICHADSFKDKETRYTDEPRMFVTWDPVEDTASGLLGYYVSQANNSGTSNGSFMNDTEEEFRDLEEGLATVYVWCVDRVGNIGIATGSGIFVDLTPPVFSNPVPGEGSWHNHTDIRFSIDVLDLNGSGVDGGSIEYSVSTTGMTGFDMWIPAWLPDVKERMVPEIMYVFHEGEDNYIKWRAKDISENGFVESAPVNIKVDITPISFGKEITPHEEWFNNEVITTSISVSDEGIGVDPDSLEARISTSGAGNFGTWMKIERDNISEVGNGEYVLTATFTYVEGKENYIMFRGTDLVGTPFKTSDKFNLKIDTTPAYFRDFAPGADSYSDEREVECFVSIFDNGSGVNVNSVEYSYSTEGAEEDEFGPWKKPLNVVAGNPTQVLLTIDFEWGKENYIRFRAEDRIGSGIRVSRPFNVWVNSMPSVIISSPTPQMESWSDQEVSFNATGSMDADGDNLTFFWTSNVTSNRTLSSNSSFTAKLAPGKHKITVYVSDGHGYNESEKIFIEIKEKDGGKKGDDDDEKTGEVPSESGSGNDRLLLIIAIAVILLIIILVFFFILRRNRKEKEVTPSPVQGPGGVPFRVPPYHPYSAGQYMPVSSGGYSSGQAYGRGPPTGYGTPPQRLMLPPGPTPQTFPPTAMPQQQLPPQGMNQGQMQSLPAQAGMGGGQLGDLTYLLPSFTTAEGAQNLNLMALPPGPDDLQLDLSILDPAPSPDQTSPSAALEGWPRQQEMQPAIPNLTVGNLEAPPFPGQAPIAPTEIPAQPPASPGEPAAPSMAGTPEAMGGQPAEAPVQPEPPELSVPPSPPPGQNAAHTDPIDALFGSLLDGSIPPPEDPPENPAPNPPEEPSPQQVREITMQCHSCASNYTATIAELPAIITCPFCQVQGMIESL